MKLQYESVPLCNCYPTWYITTSGNLNVCKPWTLDDYEKTNCAGCWSWETLDDLGTPLNLIHSFPTSWHFWKVKSTDWLWGGDGCKLVVLRANSLLWSQGSLSLLVRLRDHKSAGGLTMVSSMQGKCPICSLSSLVSMASHSWLFVGITRVKNKNTTQTKNLKQKPKVQVRPWKKNLEIVVGHSFSCFKHLRQLQPNIKAVSYCLRPHVGIIKNVTKNSFVTW